MKHLLPRILAFWALALAFPTFSVAQQSLGDAAREIRKKKPAEPTTKVITNEDIGTAPTSRPVATGTIDASTPKSASDATEKPSASKENAKAAANNQAELDKQWQEKIAAQKDQIALLERELDVLQRENRLRASSYYGDAGARLRNERQYAEEDRKYRDQITTKQKAIDDAKTRLEQLKEDARKAGATVGG